MSKEWTIVEHKEYKKTIRRVPRHIRERIEKFLKPQMEEYPFIDDADKRPLRNKCEGFCLSTLVFLFLLSICRHLGHCEGFYEQKIDNYRLVFRILNYNSKTVEFSWIRQKPHATSKRWVS